MMLSVLFALVVMVLILAVSACFLGRKCDDQRNRWLENFPNAGGLRIHTEGDNA